MNCRFQFPIRALALTLLVAPLASRAMLAAEPLKVAILVYDHVELLDFSGPGEVFASSFTPLGRRAFDVFTVAADKTPVTSQGFVNIVPDYSIADSPRPDILVVPGGRDSIVTRNPALMQWIRDVAAHGKVVMSVCSGAFVLADAGLLDGKEATSHHGSVQLLAHEHPDVLVRPGTRFVDNGRVMTTAGVSAGIDGALHLVARLHGLRVAQRTAEYMEYAWSPDSRYGSDYPTLDPTLDASGRAVERARLLQEKGDDAGALSVLRQSVAGGQGPWYALGRMLHKSGDLGGALDAYGRVPADSPDHAQALYNSACIQALRGEIDSSLGSLSASIAAGFHAVGWMMHDPDLAKVRHDPRFAKLVKPLL